MKICTKCGATLTDDVKFCAQCGTTVEEQAVQQPTQTQQSNEATENFVDKIKELNNTTDETADFDQKDINDNKGICVLAYLGPLVFVPMFARKNSKFARFHSNQGLTFMIASIAYSIIQNVLLAILRSIFPYNWNYGYLGGRGIIFDALSTILSLVWIVIGILCVIGIINAASGKAKQLPLIGKIKFLK